MALRRLSQHNKRHPKRWLWYVDGDITSDAYVKYKAIKEVCAYYAVPVWNGNTEFVASHAGQASWAAKYMPDSLHPNEVGHKWYANRVENFVLSNAE